MKYYDYIYDADEEVIETENYYLNHDFLSKIEGLTITQTDNINQCMGKSIFISKIDLNNYIKYNEFSDIIDNYCDSEVDAVFDRLFELKVFL